MPSLHEIVWVTGPPLGTVTVAMKEPFTSVVRGVGLVVNEEPSQVTVTAVEEANP